MSTIMSKTASEVQRGTEIGENWASVMQMSIEDVQKLFEEDAYGAMVKMVEGLEMVDESGGNLDATLRELGINEIRQLDVLKRLTGSSKDLTEAQRMANDEWEKNAALIDESNARYETFESQLRIFKNSIDNIFSNFGNAFVQSSDGIINKIVEVVQEFDRWTDTMFDTKGGLNEIGQEAVDTAKNIIGITTALGIVGAAFFAFGPTGAVVSAVVLGLGAIGIATNELSDFMGSGSAIDNALRDLSFGLSDATEGKAKEYTTMKDEILSTVADLRMGIADESGKTIDEVLGNVEELTKQITLAMDEEFQKSKAVIEGMMEGATEPQQKMLQSHLESLEAAYQVGTEQISNSSAELNRIFENAFRDNRRVTDHEFDLIIANFDQLDTVFATSAAQNARELQKLSQEFSGFNEDTSFDKVQSNVTDFAENSVEMMNELSHAFEENKKVIEESTLSDQEKAEALSVLEQQYLETQKSVLDNLKVYETEAQMIDKNVDALAGLTGEQKRALGIIDELRNSTTNYGTVGQILREQEEVRTSTTKNLNDAIKDHASRLDEATATADNFAEAYAGLDGTLSTIPDMMAAISDSSDEVGYNLGLGFVSRIEDGVAYVDLGAAGEVKVEEFVQGIRSGGYSVEEVSIAQINAMRASIGAESLTPEGQEKMLQFVDGFVGEGENLVGIMESLGGDLAAGMEVDLGASGTWTMERFVSGLASGEFGVVEVMTFYQNQLEELSNVDLTLLGEGNIATLQAGMESGFITAEQVVATFAADLPTNVKIDLEENGVHSLQTLSDGFRSGEIDVVTYFEGLEEIVKELASMDLTETSGANMDTYIQGMSNGKEGINEEVSLIKNNIEEQLNLDLSPEGGETTSSFAQGMLENKFKVDEIAEKTKLDTETKLGETEDGGGGAKSATTFHAGFANLAPWIAELVTGTKTDAESTLGSTTDGDGGTNAGGAFASGIASQIGNAQAASDSAKTTVEGSLGSTTDASGGDKAGGMFVSGIAGQIANAASAANSNKSEVEGELGATTDADGGRKALQMYVAAITSYTTRARMVATMNSDAVEAALGATTDDGGGRKAGQMFVSGVAGQAGASRSAGSTVSNSARSGLSSNSNTYGLGQNFGSGFVSGIRSYIGAAISAATSLARSALNAVKSAQRSASPSKETMKLGGDFGDGFSLAIVDKTKEAVNAARNMARDAIDAAGDESARNALAVDVGGMEYGGSAPRSVNQRIQHEITANTADRERVVANVHIHQHGDLEWLRTEIAERDGVDATLKF